ncbi:MAG TPA: 2-amino-4-hydroxy-6-hydroxymethyldihydropteridine diphosphokinase [Firmicutes bacterium]|nr:2-amino-4-hydroxy-6-hydroxymethyldihydropteridine diphosphokinase [Bacillota bacterium]
MSSRSDGTQTGDGSVPVYFGLGSNLGDRLGNLRCAAAMLGQADGLSQFAVSRVYETEPWGFVDQPPFLNCVVRAHTLLEPEDVLAVTRSVEDALGRERSLRWGPRIIDVDILIFGGLVMDTEDLVIPHPRMWERAFVLVPLMDLAPDMITPDGATLSQKVADLGDAGGVRVFDGDLQGVFDRAENIMM